MSALYQKKPPTRPSELLGSERVDQMWRLMGRCWDHDPAARPTALSVLNSVGLRARQNVAYGLIGGFNLQLQGFAGKQ